MTSNKTNTISEGLRQGRVLEILLNEIPVGVLTLAPPDQNMFTFRQSYIDNPQRPTLSLQFKSATGALITHIKPTRMKLPTFFSNLLPEGALREYLALKTGVNPDREFFLLSALGDDLPGAIIARPATSDLAQALSEPAEPFIDEPHENVLRFSLAGVQLKFSAIRETNRGLTIPASGIGGSWIVKLPDNRFADVPETEYSMLKLASGAGMDIAEADLIDTRRIEGLPRDIPDAIGKSLAIKRFDRRADGRRIHMEDFAQILDLYPRNKYGKASHENLATVIWQEIGEDALVEFVRRIVFSAAIGNADMHVKNWSLVYPDGRNAQLAPGYDFVPTIVYMSTDSRMALSIGRIKDMYLLDADVFRKFAGRARLPEHLVVLTVKETAGRIMDAWRESKADLPISRKARESIEKHMDGVPVMKSAVTAAGFDFSKKQE